jgi:electron transport complex protein RnfD
VLVTAWLLALCLPTLAPWWLYLVGMIFAVVVAKHLYGGLGQNLFNPAMVGYAALIVSFPVYMTQWAAPLGMALHDISLGEAFDLVFAGQGAISVDAYTAATALDTWKTQVRLGKPAEDILALPAFGWGGAQGQEFVALAYLFGGLLLLANRLITWHIPAAFLGSVALTAWGLHLLNPGQHAGPLFHLLSGGVMLGAFFIATDPVSAATTPRGKLLYAGLAGFITVLIRGFGGYPDGVAFSILLMNVAAPFIDTYTQPRVFGHRTGEKAGGRKEAP